MRPEPSPFHDLTGIDIAHAPTRIRDGNHGDHDGHEAISRDHDGLRDVGRERGNQGANERPQRNENGARLEQLFERVYSAPPSETVTPDILSPFTVDDARLSRFYARAFRLSGQYALSFLCSKHFPSPPIDNLSV